MTSDGEEKFVPQSSQKKRKASYEETQVNLEKSKFIVDDVEYMEEEIHADGYDSENDQESSDYVCAICDNGGEILCCEGRCLRSFHATKDAGAESFCKSLGLAKAKVDAIKRFFCPNCRFKQHQCFACGKLGSSDKSFHAEVFCCVSATCGHFYHPVCVSRLLHHNNEAEAKEHQKRIAAGEPFICPVHKCIICKEGEKKEVEDLQFAVCRRCPKTYHRKCLPRKISVKPIIEEGIMQRAWSDLIPNRLLIYCLKHKIEEDLMAPRRNHLLFPYFSETKKSHPLNLYSSMGKVVVKDVVSEDLSKEKSTIKMVKKVVYGTLAIKESCTMLNNEEISLSKLPFDSLKKLKAPESIKDLKDVQKPLLLKAVKSSASEKKLASRVERLKNVAPSKKLCTIKSKPQEMSGGKPGKTKSSTCVVKKPLLLKADKSSASEKNLASRVERFTNLPLKKRFTNSVPNRKLCTIESKPKEMSGGKPGKTKSSTCVVKKPSGSSSLLDNESKSRILDIIKKASSSVTLEDIRSKHKQPVTHKYKSSNVGKSITQGKVEGYIEAVQTALRKLEEGCNVEGAKAICGPEILKQIIDWKLKLKVYLAPFLLGMRYTSFGRHFTKVDKLKELVDDLHWYVQNGDMVVDFCCGANDFSCLMRDKLEEYGKKCSFKNYDLIQPKNDFNFEKRDWMSVSPLELPDGSNLIMGLNPPFGVKASLANGFINKALKFKPKLLILIVPEETERLDVKRSRCDLIWEDRQRFAGKSFYLPGSVDVEDKQMDQRNLKAPVLYVWSRPDWTPQHMAVAAKQGHASTVQNHVKQLPYKWSKDLDFNSDMGISDDFPVQNDQVEASQEERTMVAGKQKEASQPKYNNTIHEDGGGYNDHKNSMEGTHKNRRREDHRRHEMVPFNGKDSISFGKGGPCSNQEFGTGCESMQVGTPNEDFRNAVWECSSDNNDLLTSGIHTWSTPSHGTHMKDSFLRNVNDKDVIGTDKQELVKIDHSDTGAVEMYGHGNVRKLMQLYGQEDPRHSSEIAKDVNDKNISAFDWKASSDDWEQAEGIGWPGIESIEKYRFQDTWQRRQEYSYDLSEMVWGPTSHGLLGAAVDSSRQSTSVMQQHAPHLNEMNYPRPSMPQFSPMDRSSMFTCVMAKDGCHGNAERTLPHP